MVRQYRNALDRYTIELPAGCRDSLTEDTKISAMRELEEETGFPVWSYRKDAFFKDDRSFSVMSLLMYIWQRI